MWVDGANTYCEDGIKVAGEVHVRKLYGYHPSFVYATRDACVPPMTVVAYRFPDVVLEAHRHREQPLLTACFAQFVKKFQALPVRTRVISECLRFMLALVGEGNAIILSLSIASISFWVSDSSEVKRSTCHPGETKLVEQE